MAATLARSLQVPSIELGGWKFKRGSTLMAISWFGSRTPGFWNTGRDLDSGKPEHSVESMWLERFLEYPDDPASGPLWKADASIYRAERKPKTIEDDKKEGEGRNCGDARALLPSWRWYEDLPRPTLCQAGDDVFACCLHERVRGRAGR